MQLQSYNSYRYSYFWVSRECNVFMAGLILLDRYLSKNYTLLLYVIFYSRFPKKPEVMITYEGIQLRMHQLEEYLYNLLNISIYRNHHETVSKICLLKHILVF